MIKYFIPLIISFLLSVGLTLVVKKLAWRLKILDYPKEERKVHKKPIPLLGGMAIFLSFFLVLAFFYPEILSSHVKFKNLLGIFIGSLILMIGGYLDDRYDLKPRQQVIWPILAILLIIASGIGIREITNPFGE